MYPDLREVRAIFHAGHRKCPHGWVVTILGQSKYPLPGSNTCQTHRQDL